MQRASQSKSDGLLQFTSKISQTIDQEGMNCAKIDCFDCVSIYFCCLLTSLCSYDSIQSPAY